MKNSSSIGISHLAYELPKTKLTLHELAKKKILTSPRSLLKEFGFTYCYIGSHHDQAVFPKQVGKKILTQNHINLETISHVLIYSGVQVPRLTRKTQVLNAFCYDSHKLSHDLHLTHAHTIALSEQGCSGLLTMIKLAHSLLQNQSTNAACLCIAYDFLPQGSVREILYNVISDATAAVIVSRNSSKNEIIGYHQISQSYYWDTPAREQELLAAYFPMAVRAITTCLKKANIRLEEIRWIVPHNVSTRSWQILSKMLNIPHSKVWSQNISRVGHTVSCDHIINISDMEKAKEIKKRDLLLLFTFGFGASWTCMILKH